MIIKKRHNALISKISHLEKYSTLFLRVFNSVEEIKHLDYLVYEKFIKIVYVIEGINDY